MDDAAPANRAAPSVLDRVDEAVDRAADALLASQRPDGHFVFELEADATIPAEYVLLRHYLGENVDGELEAKIGRYLRRIQGAHGGWPLFHGGALDVSATVKAYFALKMIGDPAEAPHMVRARAALLARGGAGACNVFTRFLLAHYGVIPWEATPRMPVEIILLPRWFPVHLDKISYWARTVVVPLLVLRALRPKATNSKRVRIDEIFVSPPARLRGLPRGAHRKEPWASLFLALDVILGLVEPRLPKRWRSRAISRAEAFVGERLNGEDGLGAIFPAMANAVMMYAALGYGADHLSRATARASIEKLLMVGDEEAYCQPCLSPVWDTALASHALIETNSQAARTGAVSALDWLVPRQVLDVAGDWSVQRPAVRPGGWAFQYANPHYPDLDDTAVVVMAMDRARGRLANAGSYEEAISRGAEWVRGLQCRNGGWAAFDADNTHHYLNNIPFADHGALLDPPTVDVAARCVSMLAQLGEDAASAPMKAALGYLEREQEKDGSWFGRWGVNYIYGAWSALCALNAAGVAPDAPMVRAAAAWLVDIQNLDGGWGEGCDSYRLDYAGYQTAPSAASQTAWALLGLMAADRADLPAVERGIGWLARHQRPDGAWDEPGYTGGGFPRVFYLRYHGYAQIFPLWALARFRNLKRGNEGRVAFGM